MIRIEREEDCVGCGGCVQICPKHCISFKADRQGFHYPHVEVDKCIECGLCEKVCPVIHQGAERTPLKVYAAHNRHKEVRKLSSSGGVFNFLARRVLQEGGVVFGARFDKHWGVKHDYTETEEGLIAFQGSKYVQSDIGDTYRKAEEFLNKGRRVLFSGTPCQISGLRRYLRKDYGNLLLTVDVICHGVPSPRIWKEYLDYKMRPKGASAGKNTVCASLSGIPGISGISFRDKRYGWEKYGLCIRKNVALQGDKNSVCTSVTGENCMISDDIYESLRENIYMQGFLRDLYLRPSCYNCPSKSGKSGSDITLGDFWRVRDLEPEAYCADGTSLLLVNSNEADQLLQSPEIELISSSYEKALRSNGSIVESAVKPKYYREFWKSYASDGISALGKILKKVRGTLFKRGLRYLKRIILSR